MNFQIIVNVIISIGYAIFYKIDLYYSNIHYNQNISRFSTKMIKLLVISIVIYYSITFIFAKKIIVMCLSIYWAIRLSNLYYRNDLILGIEFLYNFVCILIIIIIGVVSFFTLNWPASYYIVDIVQENQILSKA